jgi:signal transduction histidine kinase
MGQELLRPFTIGQVMHHSCGTALNLALANAIVTTYGGQLRAESAGVGKGATFTGEFATVTLL